MSTRRPTLRTRSIKPLTLITGGRVSQRERHARLTKRSTRQGEIPGVVDSTPCVTTWISLSIGLKRCVESCNAVQCDAFGRRRARDKGMSISTFQEGQNCIGSPEHVLSIGQIRSSVKGGQGENETPLTKKSQDVSGITPPGRTGQGETGGCQIRNTGGTHLGESEKPLYNKRCRWLPLTALTGGVHPNAVQRLSGQGWLTLPLTTPDHAEVVSHV
ncbi:hypothetical protein SAMN05192552_105019 [Natrinema hispanicum]|uniref:Uncharacterized protein n=1 Tax=Natrinema hispanicum TaxID=392421 RepID=A0A1G6XQE3_9EURY|nr:hypothetical protein SAMN05192552_105019 [Natrinema hispanicum]